MKKRFNITGLCFSDQHYMADVSKKLARTMDMVEQGDYFIINRPRQYGKTTLLNSLSDALTATGEYLVFSLSFEGIGNSMYRDETALAKGFSELLGEVIAESAPSHMA